MGDHMLAWLKFGAGLVMIGHVNEDVHRIRSPRDVGSTTVDDQRRGRRRRRPLRRAVAEGAEITKALEDTWYRPRVYEAADLEGHQWHFQESNDHIPRPWRNRAGIGGSVAPSEYSVRTRTAPLLVAAESLANVSGQLNTV